jgi:hypothetical protein
MVFNESKPDFVIESDRFRTLINEYNTTKDNNSISISKLTELKFCRELPATSEYKISGNYTNFLEFIFDDFVLDLPETLKNRYNTIFNLYSNLQSTTDENKIIMFIRQIIVEIESFLNDIQHQTFRLLRDTESLKVNADNLTDLTQRIQKANFWIDEYINPLNAVLNKEHPDAIIATITNIQTYASEKRFLVTGYKLNQEFSKLYSCTVNTKTELDQTLGKLTRELLPLLERIKSDSIILSGFYHFVENIDNSENYIIPLPNLLSKENNSVISKIKGVADTADYFIEQFNYKVPEITYKEESEKIEWLPDTRVFKKQLLKENGSDNFYQWCYDVLEQHTNNITLAKFFTVSNLILEEDLSVEYADNHKFEIQLSDAKLKIPKVKIYELSK